MSTTDAGAAGDIATIVAAARAERRHLLSEPEAKALLRACGIPVPTGRVIRDAGEAATALAVVGPIVWSDKADTNDTSNILAGPSADHWAGTDNLGRDIFYRTLVASRLSLELALAATVIAVVVGLVLGTAAFLLGRRLGRLVSAVINIAVAFPGILLALFFAVVFGVGATGAVLAIGLAGAPAFGRLVHRFARGGSAVVRLSENFADLFFLGGKPLKDLRVVSDHRLLAGNVLGELGKPSGQFVAAAEQPAGIFLQLRAGDLQALQGGRKLRLVLAQFG